MKTILYILFAIIILGTVPGCHSNPDDQFTLEVTLQHIPAAVQNAYLEEIRVTDTRLIDTAAIDPSTGRFIFRGLASEEGLYRIRLQDSSLFYTVLAPGNIRATGDYLHPDRITTEGSPASEALTGFLTRLNEKTNTLSASLQKGKMIPQQDSIRMAYHKTIASQSGELHHYILQTARTTTHPVVAVFALNLMRSPEELISVRGIYDSLDNRFPHNALVGDAVAAYKKMMNDSGLNTALTAGDPAPEITANDTTGKSFSLNSLQGKYVLVDFWASWCEPCRKENPNIVKAWNQFKNKNFAILGVSLDTKKTSWEKAILEDHLPWHHISDLKGWNSQPARIFGVQALPANFLVDPAGKIIATNLGGETLIDSLGKILHQ